MERILSVTVDADCAGRDVKYILKTRLMMSARLIVQLKRREDGIMLNGAPVYVTHKVAEGDVLVLKISEEGERSPNVVATEGEVEVVYEDDDVMLINKPAGLSVHPSMGNYYDTLANRVAYRSRERGESFVFRPVNRLDRNTSGLMLVAKNSYAQDRLSHQHRSGELVRSYIALCCGVIKDDAGVIEAPIARARESAIEREVRSDGKYARTGYQVIERFDVATLVRLTPVTGRTHQIRVHMAHIGHPLAGDFLYGQECCEVISRHALHSYKISFAQPCTGQWMEFSSALPSDMQRAIEIMDGKGIWKNVL